MELTAEIPSPEIYRLWSAITTISGVLERKVWTVGKGRAIYPNIFTVLVGPPGSGKTNSIYPIRELWAKMKGLNIGPDDVTRPSLIDAISGSMKTVVNSDATTSTFSSLVLPCSEFGVFFTHHDTSFLSFINHIWDSPNYYEEKLRTSGTVELIKPYLVLLAGTQPDYLNAFLPEEAWGMGFTSRLIMIYASKAPIVDMFGTTENTMGQLIPQLAEIFDLKGSFVWSLEAANEMNAWRKAGAPPEPDHSRLLHYNTRRALHVAKLSMISAVSRSANLIVKLEDFERAQNWLIEAEKPMPDIFRAMGAKSDKQVLLDLHRFLYRLWSSVAVDRRKPVPEAEIYRYLAERTTSDKVPRLLELGEKAGYINRGHYSGTWLPGNLEKLASV